MEHPPVPCRPNRKRSQRQQHAYHPHPHPPLPLRCLAPPNPHRHRWPQRHPQQRPIRPQQSRIRHGNSEPKRAPPARPLREPRCRPQRQRHAKQRQPLAHRLNRINRRERANHRQPERPQPRAVPQSLPRNKSRPNPPRKIHQQQPARQLQPNLHPRRRGVVLHPEHFEAGNQKQRIARQPDNRRHRRPAGLRQRIPPMQQQVLRYPAIHQRVALHLKKLLQHPQPQRQPRHQRQPNPQRRAHALPAALQPRQLTLAPSFHTIRTVQRNASLRLAPPLLFTPRPFKPMPCAER